MDDMISKFHKYVGKEYEFKLFLDMIHSTPKEKFGVIKISGQSLENHMDAIAENIAFLNQMDIYPIIVHGAGTTLDKRLPHSVKVDGLRVTNGDDMVVIKEVFDKISCDLEEKIKSYGGNAVKSNKVFECEPLEKYGHVGSINDVHPEEILKLIKHDISPIISPIGYFGGTYLNVNADTAAKELVTAISPKKWLLLTEPGGVLDASGKVVSFLNTYFVEDYPELNGGMLYKVKELVDFVKKNQYCEVVITSAEDLLKEIFTIKGSGTFIKYHEIINENDLSKIDISKIHKLIRSAFCKDLVQGYFSDVKEVFYEKSYEGIAMIKEIMGLPYLDKFAVTKARQGTGLGDSIWKQIVKEYPKMMWRANPNNPCNKFYMEHCDGQMQSARWNFYWKNLSNDEILSAYEKVVNLEDTLVPTN